MEIKTLKVARRRKTEPEEQCSERGGSVKKKEERKKRKREGNKDRKGLGQKVKITRKKFNKK
jgi:hypothetical protein